MRQTSLVYMVAFLLAISTSFQINANPMATVPMAVQKQTDIYSNNRTGLLYMLMVAEIAASRNMKALALENYLKATELTKDPAIAEHTTKLAVEAQQALPALLAAEIWANQAPTNMQAQLVAMTLNIGNSVDKAIPFLVRALAIDPKLVNQHIIDLQMRLSEKSATQLNKALIRIANEKPTDAYANLAAAQSSAQQGDIKTAKLFSDNALKIIPDLTLALEFKARLIRYEDSNDTGALQYLAGKLKEFPKNNELRLFYANALIDAEKLSAAEQELTQITNDKNVGAEALLLLGEIYFKQNKPEKSLASVEKAFVFPHARDNAYYIAGQAEEKLGHTEKAIKYYSNISSGTFHVTATLKAVALLKKGGAFDEATYLLRRASPTTGEEQKQLLLTEIDMLRNQRQFEEAFNLSGEVLTKIPNDMDFLFIHGLSATNLKKWDVAENNFKKILTQNPNHTNTLDSIGWLYYQMGDLDKSLVYLKKATDLSDDSEITAHFSEVLWANGQKEKATALLKKALEKQPNNTVLLETQKRLNTNVSLKP